MTGTFPPLFLSSIMTIVFRNTAYATNVTVEYPSLPSFVFTTCDLPNHIDVSIHLPQETISLNLLRSTDITDSPPMFFLRKRLNGSPRISSQDKTDKTIKEVLYQDEFNDAEFEVTCIANEGTLSLDGSLKLQDGKNYRLQKSAENSRNLYNLTEVTPFTGAVDIGGDDTDASDTVEVSGVETPTLQLSTDVYIDVVVLIEFSVYERWYSRSTESTPELKRTDTLESIRRHFAHIFNAVNLRFKTASPHINMILAGYVIEDTASGEWFQSIMDTEPNKAYINANKLLRTMNMLSETEGFPAHDHLTAFTAFDIYWLVDGEPSYSLAGLASLSQICVDFGRSVSIVEYQDYFTVDVALTAHEIGHCLGARHDGTSGNECQQSDNFIMAASPSIYSNTNPFTFSTCSAEYFDLHITSFLSGRYSSSMSRSCLLERLQADSVPVVNDLIGQLSTLDEQCQIVYGNDSYVCRFSGAPSSSICLARACYNSTSDICYGRYADRGTTCGNKMWCEGGECVYSDQAPTADPDCLLGDQPLFDDGGNCSTLIESADSCSNPYREYRCCATCKEVVCGKKCPEGIILNGTTCTCMCPDCLRGTECALVCQNGGILNQTKCECECRAEYAGDECEQRQMGTGISLEVALAIGLSLFVIVVIHVLIILYCLLRKNKVHPHESGNTTRHFQNIQQSATPRVLTVGGIYPEEVKKYRNEVLLPILKQARKENKRCRVVVDKLWIEGELVTPPIPPPYSPIGTPTSARMQKAPLQNSGKSTS